MSLHVDRRLGHHKMSSDCLGEDCLPTACAAERTDLVHSCYHGSSCVDASNEFGLLDRYCECVAEGDLTAGLMCQYKATSICTTDKGQVKDQFCVNDGACVAFVGSGESHPGCVCETGKWEGRHCEFAHGVLLDDALDLFQQRKAEIAQARSMGSMDEGTAVTLGGVGGKNTVSILVAAVVLTTAFVTLSLFALCKSRTRQQKGKDRDYQSIGLGSLTSKSSNGSYETPMPPPADVFFSSRKKEADLDDESTTFMLSPGHDAHVDDADDVEMLDDATSRMIEAQFEGPESEESEEDRLQELQGEEPQELAFVASYGSDEDIDGQESGLQRGRITINSGKNPLSKLANNPHIAAKVEELVSDDENVKPTSLDGDDDDTDEDHFYV